MRPFDIFQRINAEYLESLYEQFQHDPESLDSQWVAYFAGFEAGLDCPPSSAAQREPAATTGGTRDEGAFDLVHSFRELGHFVAKLDPLGHHRPPHPLLDLDQFGYGETDLAREVGAAGFRGPASGTLGGLLESLQATYCGTLGVEYMDVADKRQRAWLQDRMEPVLNRPPFAPEECRRILSLLIAAETFEQFLHVKFVGQKRFSIEGAQSLIPLLETLIEEGAALGAEEAVLGMAHRGRLNVLAHTLHKPYELILSDFAGTATPQASEGDGDVKYHLGFSHNRVTAAGHAIHCSLSSNPSHLELVNPVIEGIVRAKQQSLGDHDHTRVVPILIHGEAAFTGQGIVPETLSLSELAAYRTGGTIHVIVNNQIGFTATADQTRFTPYPTDVAKMIQAPIFHVNGDDPEAVVHAARLAIAFRQEFKVDVMIDLWCYRRYGHNEGDDPTITQPVMYRQIAEHSPVAQSYARRLLAEKKIEAGEAETMAGEVRARLDDSLQAAQEHRPRQRISSLGGLWQGLTRAEGDWSAATAVDESVLRRVTEGALRVPPDFKIHPKVERVLEARSEMAQGAKPVDWGCAELWALGSLLLAGTPVRLVGQDTQRGTFGHRHAVLHDAETGTMHVPLAHLAKEQAPFTVLNTMLSELAVMGFEYGFSSADPRNLVIWEAQFGDFVNGAQPIIDQFLASGESKWQRMSGLVLLLPHGYEGQGPEHSSGRLERFLQLCGGNNLQVCSPTRTAQYFHVLRRQMLRTFRKPLVLLMPKSLLRDERSASSLDEFSRGTFRLIIDDPAGPDRERVRRLVLCTGKLFYLLQSARDEHRLDDMALVRLEQLYPFPKAELQAIFARYRHAHEVLWVQEEPRNMGAWSFVEPRLRELLPDASVLTYHGRKDAASPATGFFRLHQIEEERIVQQAFDLSAKGEGAGEPAEDGSRAKKVSRQH